jgi:hypothetical protein
VCGEEILSSPFFLVFPAENGYTAHTILKGDEGAPRVADQITPQSRRFRATMASPGKKSSDAKALE